MSIIDAFLAEENLDDQKEFLSKAIKKIQDQSSVESSKHEWNQIVETCQTLITLVDYSLATAFFFITIAGNRPLQGAVYRAEPTPTRRRFFRDNWLPYLKRLTEVLRQTDVVDLEKTYEQYSATLRQSWRLQGVAPHRLLPNLDSVECIHLVHLSLPQDDCPPSDQC